MASSSSCLSSSAAPEDADGKKDEEDGKKDEEDGKNDEKKFILPVIRSSSWLHYIMVIMLDHYQRFFERRPWCGGLLFFPYAHRI